MENLLKPCATFSSTQIPYLLFILNVSEIVHRRNPSYASQTEELGDIDSSWSHIRTVVFKLKFTSESLEWLVRTNILSRAPPPESLIQQVWVGAWEFAFLTSSQAMQMLTLTPLRTTALDCSRMELFFIFSSSLHGTVQTCKRKAFPCLRRHLSSNYI